MRKLVLFGLLGAIFGSALLLEHLFARRGPETELPNNKALLTVGGGPPRSIPADAPEVIDEGPIAPPPGPRPGPGGETKRERASEGAPPVGDEAEQFHTVAAKETLWTIAAAKLGGGARWPELAEWNGLASGSPLRVGTKLRLSPPRAADSGTVQAKTQSGSNERVPPASARTHKVAKGETLSKIAARYLGDASRWREIQRLNQIADPAAVGEGVVLKLPER